MLLYISQSNTFSSIINIFLAYLSIYIIYLYQIYYHIGNISRWVYLSIYTIYLSTFAIGRCLPSFSLEYVLFNCLKNPFTDPRILSLSGHTITQAISLGGPQGSKDRESQWERAEGETEMNSFSCPTVRVGMGRGSHPSSVLPR